MVKIYSVPSHQTETRTSGVDYARIFQPLKYLNGYKEFTATIFDIHKYTKMTIPQRKKYWIDNGNNFDIFFLNYTVLDWGYAIMATSFAQNNKPIVFDIDDSIWDIRPDNPTYYDYNANNQKFKHVIDDIINAADYVTTTSGYLRNIIVNNTKRGHDDIAVIPNYIDLDRYRFTFEPKEDNTITILHYGSTTHFNDLLQAPFRLGLQRIMDEYPNVMFITIGAFMSEYKYLFGRRYENYFGHEDIYKWIDTKFPEYMQTADIFVSPVEPDRYNKAKSYIKYLEASSTKCPGVYQDIYQYQEIVEDGVNGYLAASEDDWYNKIKKLIDSVELRRTIGENAYKTAQANQMKNHVDKYADVFRKALDKKKIT